MTNDIADLVCVTDLVALATKVTTLQKAGDGYRGLCPFHSERTPSFTVFDKGDKQRFHCFGCGARGDAIDFVMQLDGVDLKEAIVRLREGGDRLSPRAKTSAAFESIYDSYTPLVWPGHLPFVAGKMTPLILNPKRLGDVAMERGQFKPVSVHEYRDAANQLLGCVLRRDFGSGRKETPTIQRVRCPDGTVTWARMPFRLPRPLYGLHTLAAWPKAPVLVVEGEKAADACLELVPPYVAVTWAGGAQAWNRTDWTPLAGRQVLLWPDNDDAGKVAMEGIASILSRLEGTQVKLIDFGRSTRRPKGWDAADAVEMGWKQEDFFAWAKLIAVAWTGKPGSTSGGAAGRGSPT